MLGHLDCSTQSSLPKAGMELGMEPTSPSEAEPSEVMEQTSASEIVHSSPLPSHGRGRGGARGTSSGHGRAESASKLPKPKATIRKPKGRSKKK